MTAATVDPLVLGANLLLGALSVVVVVQCYRGYRRNDSRPLLFLGVGIGLVTMPSFLLYGLVVGIGVPPYVDLLALTQTAGLLSILYAFTRA
jgi:hypothetical protein